MIQLVHRDRDMVQEAEQNKEAQAAVEELKIRSTVRVTNRQSHLVTKTFIKGRNDWQQVGFFGVSVLKASSTAAVVYGLAKFRKNAGRCGDS